MRWRVLDGLGLLFWTYAFLKLFVVDVDRELVGTLAPAALPLLNYRAILFLALLVLAAIFWRRTLVPIAYVVGFPLIVVFVKFPWFLLRHRSFALLLTILQLATALFTDFRWNVATKSLAIVAAILIIGTDIPPLIVLGAAYIAWLLVWSAGRRLRRLASSPTFVTVQQRTIQRLVDSDALRGQWRMDEQYLRDDLTQYDETQAQQVTLRISTGVAVNKALYLWARQLERYKRRYAPSLMFNIVTYAWVFFACLLGLSLLNLALYKLDPTQYQVSGPRPPIAVLMYTLATFFPGGTAGGIEPVGELAYALQFMAGIGAGVILAVLFINLGLTYFRERDDQATEDLVRSLRETAQRQATEFEVEYAVTPDEAYRRLEELGQAALGFAAAVVRAMPDEPDPPQVPSSTES